MLACSFDLETTGFEANANVILCACIKPFTMNNKGGTVTYRFDKYPQYTTQRWDDSKLAKDIYTHLLQYDIWVAHNGVEFDDKFLRTRLSSAGIQMPKQKFIDPCKIARQNFRFGRNSLDQIAAHFGIEGKTHVDMRYWMRAKFGHGETATKAMNYIVDHCIADVAVLERMFNEIKYLVPKIDKMGSFYG